MTSAVKEVSTLLGALLDDTPASTFGRLASHVATYDSRQPVLVEASAESLRHSPALAPSPCLNSALSDLVATLLSPTASTSSAAQVALLNDPENSLMRERASAIRRVAAAAEEMLEISCAADGLSSKSSQKLSLAEMLPTFPYISNYEILADAEARIMDEALGRTASGPVAFLGSGPLPLSGIVLSIRRGIKVVLVDLDEDAVRISKEVVRMLEDGKVLQPGMIDVVCADASDLKFSRYDSARMCESSDLSMESADSLECDTVITCESIIVASLVPVPAKQAVSKALSESPGGPEVLLVRSAVGMVAEVAYERVHWRDIVCPGLQYHGEWVPHRGANNVAEDCIEPLVGSYRPQDSGAVLAHDEILLGYIDGRVLNSVQVYLSSP